MIEGLSIVTAAVTCPVTLVDLKRHMRILIDDDEQDELIEQLILEATDVVERETNRQLVVATYKLRLQKFTRNIEIPVAPLVAVDTVKYNNTSEVLTTVSASVYEAVTDREPGFIRLLYNQDWPTDLLGHVDDIEIQFQAGYATVAEVPDFAKSAIMLWASFRYENREAFGTRQAARFEVPGFLDLCWGNRVMVNA